MMNRSDFLKSAVGFTALLMANPLGALERSTPPNEFVSRIVVTPEFLQDLRGYFGLNPREEFVCLLRDEFSYELNNRRGTLTAIPWIQSYSQTPVVKFKFVEDGKNGKENCWGLKFPEHLGNYISWIHGI